LPPSEIAKLELHPAHGYDAVTQQLRRTGPYGLLQCALAHTAELLGSTFTRRVPGAAVPLQQIVQLGPPQHYPRLQRRRRGASARDALQELGELLRPLRALIARDLQRPEHGGVSAGGHQQLLLVVAADGSWGGARDDLVERRARACQLVAPSLQPGQVQARAQSKAERDTLVIQVLSDLGQGGVCLLGVLQVSFGFCPQKQPARAFERRGILVGRHLSEQLRESIETRAVGVS